jgi:hypothetical protein
METTLGPQLGSLVMLGMSAGLLIAYELCYRLGRVRREEAHEARRSQADVALAALFALLGLLLAFSFEIGESRFDRRKEIVLDEGTAIETAYLRAATIPHPHDARIQALLRRYAEHRLGVHTPEDLENAIRESATEHSQLWAETTEVARESPTPVVTLFVESVNRVLDLHEARITVGLFQRMPPAIFTMLYIVSLLAMGMVGLRAGFDRIRGWFVAVVLVIAIMSVIAMIDSLDSPISRLFRVSQYAIEHARAVMANNQTAAQ